MLRNLARGCNPRCWFYGRTGKLVHDRGFLYHCSLMWECFRIRMFDPIPSEASRRRHALCRSIYVTDIHLLEEPTSGSRSRTGMQQLRAILLRSFQDCYFNHRFLPAVSVASSQASQAKPGARVDAPSNNSSLNSETARRESCP